MNFASLLPRRAKPSVFSLIFKCNAQYSSRLVRKHVTFSAASSTISNASTISKNVHYQAIAKSTDQGVNLSAPDEVELLEELLSKNRLKNKERLNILSGIWDLLNKRMVMLNEKHFMLKLKCYLKCDYKISPKLFIKEAKDAGVEPTEKMLKLLLAVVAEHGDEGYVSSVVTSMKSRNYPADDEVFASLVIAHGVRGDLTKALQVLDTMKESGIRPGPMVYTALMRAAAMTGDYSAIHTAKTLAADKGVKLESSHILAVLKTLIKHGNQHLLPSLKNSISLCSRNSLAALMEESVYAGYPEGAYAVLKLIIDEENIETQCIEFIHLLFESKTLPMKILKVCSDLVEDGLYTRAMYDGLEIILREMEVEQGLMALQICKERDMEIRPHFFWPLLTASYEKNGEKGIFKILEEMVKMDVGPDVETLTEMVLPRLNLDESSSVLFLLRDVTLLPLSKLIGPFLAQVIKNGLLINALELSKKYEKSIPKDWLETLQSCLAKGFLQSSDFETTVSLLQHWGITNVGPWLLSVVSARKRITSDLLTKLLQELNNAKMVVIPRGDERWLHRKLSMDGLLLPQVERLLEKLIKEDMPSPETSPPIPHPSTMKLEQLECHVRELESKGMNSRGALRKLIQMCVRSGHMDFASQAYKKLIDGGMEESPGILSSMFEAHTQAGNTTVACNLLEEIESKYPEFQVDAYKIVDLATLLIKNNRFEGM